MNDERMVWEVFGDTAPYYVRNAKTGEFAKLADGSTFRDYLRGFAKHYASHLNRGGVPWIS